jgi:hypothetical protein
MHVLCDLSRRAGLSLKKRSDIKTLSAGSVVYCDNW